jgi:hypothetical protein
MAARFPPVVQDVTRDLLAALDAEAPGLVEGFYVTGSVALADFRTGLSDIDFVGVTSMPVAGAAIDAVRRAHARLPKGSRRPALDGIYVTWAELATDPRQLPPGVRVHGRKVAGCSSAGRHPVTWQEMADVAVACRGPSRDSTAVWTDAAALRGYSLTNLDTYWRAWTERRRSLARPAGIAALGSWAPAWAVLGVSRLRYVLETGQITSKTGAGEYARSHLDVRWRAVIDECLRLRRGKASPAARYGAVRRRREALALASATIAEFCPS